MPTPVEVRDEINACISKLVQMGLCDDQNFACVRRRAGDVTEVTFDTAEAMTVVLKNVDYSHVYRMLRADRLFSALLPDTAMLQLNYEFNGRDLMRSRLAFLPSPDLRNFQSDPEIYLEDVIFAEVVGVQIVPFPLRFDYDARPGVFRSLDHPKSHLTLGQYENCRIPLTGPMPPAHFFDFILRNLYHTAFLQYAQQLPRTGLEFESCISAEEEAVIHMRVPRELHRSANWRG